LNEDFTIAEFEEKANTMFLQALSDLPTRKMHNIYVNFCLERLNLNSQFLNEEVAIFICDECKFEFKFFFSVRVEI